MIMLNLFFLYIASLPGLSVALLGYQSPVIINEIDVDNTGYKEIAEFIELKAPVSAGRKVPPLQPYMVIVVKAYDPATKGPVIIFSADLYHSTFPQNSRYFVIGSKSASLDP